jgi:recombinational DNA repair protein (RecF pathway)
MSIVTKDMEEEDQQDRRLQLQQSFLRLTANLLMPVEIIGNKYPFMQIFIAHYLNWFNLYQQSQYRV